MFIKAKVFAGAKTNEITKEDDDLLKIKIKSNPEKGKANQAVIKLVAGYLGIPQNKIKIVRGLKQRNKVLKIEN